MFDDDVVQRVVSAGFHERVYAVVREVPPGAVTTYGDVATMLGSPRVARHVGWALAALGEGEREVPWHRVINAQGAISFKGDTVRAELQAARLRGEGVAVTDRGRIEDFGARRWAYPGRRVGMAQGAP